MADHIEDPDRREIPEPVESETRRATGMGEPGTFRDEAGAAADATDATAAGGAGERTRRRPETRRATGMGNPGTFPDDRGAVEKARHAASGKLEDAAQRVRHLGDRAAEKNRLLGQTRPLVYNAAEGIDYAADYVRTRELDEMRTDLETQVRRHPLASVAVAFLAGYTLRRLF